MKRATLILLAVLLTAPTAALAQEWKVYSYPDEGVAFQLPAPPTVEKATYKTPAGASLPMTRYALRQDGIQFTLEVVDYSRTNADPMATIAETEKSFGATGKVTVAIDARIQRSFGRELSVDKADGGRSAVAIFFLNKHLVLLDGESLPPDRMAKSGDAIRFQQSLQFLVEDAGFGGFGGIGQLGGPGGRFEGPGGGPGPGRQAAAVCVGKAAGAKVQLDGPEGPIAATCVLMARPNMPPRPPPGD
jgi:hypothetical protein